MAVRNNKAVEREWEKGLKELGVTKSRVDIKILDQEDKRSFFSILAPRTVRVELTIKENIEPELDKKVKKEKVDISDETEKKAEQNIKEFLDNFSKSLPNNDLKYTIENDKNDILVDINGKDTGFLIGYRGNVLNSLQVILNNIANKGINERVRVLLNIGGYKQKREQDLKELAEKIAGTVIRKGKSIT